MRAAVVGGGAYMAGKHVANRQADQAAMEADQDARISDLEQQQAPAPAPAPARGSGRVLAHDRPAEPARGAAPAGRPDRRGVRRGQGQAVRLLISATSSRGCPVVIPRPEHQPVGAGQRRLGHRTGPQPSAGRGRQVNSWPEPRSARRDSSKAYSRLRTTSACSGRAPPGSPLGVHRGPGRLQRGEHVGDPGLIVGVREGFAQRVQRLREIIRAPLDVGPPSARVTGGEAARRFRHGHRVVESRPLRVRVDEPATASWRRTPSGGGPSERSR